MSQDVTDAGIDHGAPGTLGGAPGAPGAASGANSGVRMRPPISFLRWAGPVMAVWVPVCGLYFVGTRDLEVRVIGAAFFLFPVYAVIYACRLNYQVSDQNYQVKILSNFLLFFICLPIIYIAPNMLMIFAALIGFLIVSMGVMTIDVSLSGGAHVGGLLGMLLAAMAVGAIYGFPLSLWEKLTIGSTRIKTNVLGTMWFGGAAAVLSAAPHALEMPIPFAIATAAGFPLPHLYMVWRQRLRGGGIETSQLTPGRALIVTAVVFVSVYVLGLSRMHNEYRISDFLWPRAIVENRVRHAFEEVRAEILTSPGGRGALPIGGRSFFVAPRSTNGGSGVWRDANHEYASITVRVPYEDWIEGFDRGDVETTGRNGRRLQSARLSLSIVAPVETQDGAGMLCVPRDYFGLRQCFMPERGGWWLENLGIDPNALMRLHVDLSYRPPDSRPGQPPMFLLYAWEEPGRDGPGADGMIVQCDLWTAPEIGEDIEGFPPPSAIAHECAVSFQYGPIRVSASIDPVLVPYWRQIEAGMRQDLAAWEAAAEGVESIDVFARRQAEFLAEERARAPFWRDIHCILVAAVGTRWTIGRGSPLRSLGECPPIIRPQQGQEAG